MIAWLTSFLTKTAVTTRHKKVAAMLALAIALAACSRQEHAAPAPKQVLAAPIKEPASVPVQPRDLDKQTTQALMRALFETYDADKNQALVGIENDNTAGYFLMTLVATNTLPDGRVVAVVNGSPSDENGSDMTAHAATGLLNVYVLRRERDAWTVLERHEGVGDMGSNGQIGSVRWLNLGAGKPGFIVSSGGVWQGYTMSMADLFELGKEVRSLGAFKLSSSSEGACMPSDQDCWDVDSQLRLVDQPRPDGYRDLLVDFKGKRFTVTADAKGDFVQHVKTRFQQTARYRFNGKEYALVDGANPVPDL